MKVKEKRVKYILAQLVETYRMIYNMTRNMNMKKIGQKL